MGEDPVATTPPARDVSPPIALRWDAGTRDFLKDTAGLYLSVHPVDQRVGLAMSIIEGTLSSVPAFGNRLRRVRYAGGAALLATVSDIVRYAVRSPLAAGDIEIVAIRVETPNPEAGAIAVQLDYKNLRTKTTQTASANL